MLTVPQFPGDDMGGLASRSQLQNEVGANISSYSAAAFALLHSNFTANRAAFSGGAVYQVPYHNTLVCEWQSLISLSIEQPLHIYQHFKFWCISSYCIPSILESPIRASFIIYRNRQVVKTECTAYVLLFDSGLDD